MPSKPFLAFKALMAFIAAWPSWHSLLHRLRCRCLHGLHRCLLLHHLWCRCCLHGLHRCLLLHHLRRRCCLHGLHRCLLLHHLCCCLHGLHRCLLLHHLCCCPC